ncbi:MAG: hypothetical protein NDP19_05805 [Crenarchaeota archaeon]|nr:hypothetical protein [Thermoproteota archaeon]
MTLSNNFAFIDNFIVSTIVQQLLLVAAAAMYVRAVLGARDLRSVMLVPLALLIFTGVGWSYLMVYPPQTSDKWFETLVAANEKTYRSVMYCQLTYFWPAPFGLAMSLYLLFLSNIMTSKSSEKIITILLSFALSTIHFPESIFLCIILSLIMFLRPKSFTADFVKDFVIGCLMGASLMKALEIMRLKGNIDLMSLTASYLIILLPLIALLLNNIGFVRNFMSFLSCKFTNLLNSKLNRIVVFSIHIFFLAGLLAAYDQSTDFAVSRADPGSVIGLVPWFMYPFLLGFMLPFGFTELVLNSSLDKKSKKLTIIIIFLAVLFGKTLSYINLHTYTGYWGEKRFLVFIYLALLPYSISLLNRALEYVFGSLNRRRSLLLYLLISLISVLSFGNILHYSAFWENYSRRAMMNDFEVGLSQFLSDLLWQNPERWVLPFGSRIWAVTNHAAPVYNTYVILPLDKILQPEHAFWMVNAYDLDAAPYFTTFKGRGNELLIAAGRKLLEIGNYEVYDVPHLSPVTRRSDSALLKPLPDEGKVRDFAYVSLLLSRLSLNYTVASIFDMTTGNYSAWLLPFDTCDPLILEALKGSVAINPRSVVVINLGPHACLYNVVKSDAAVRSLSGVGLEVFEGSIDGKSIVYIKINGSINTVLWDNASLNALHSVLSKYVRSFVRAQWSWWEGGGNVGATTLTARDAVLSARSIVVMHEGTPLCIDDACFSDVRFIQILQLGDTPLLKVDYIAIARGYGYYVEAKCANATLLPQSMVLIYSKEGVSHALRLDKPLSLAGNLTLLARDLSITSAEAVLNTYSQRLAGPFLPGEMLIKGGTISIKYLQGSGNYHVLNVSIAGSRVILSLISNVTMTLLL